jgi:hypothetical protein
MLGPVTEAAPPPMNEPPSGRAVLRVAALRGGVASLIVLWILVVVRLHDVWPGGLLFPGFAALAIASALLLCLWRLHMNRIELDVTLGFFVCTPLLGLALIDPPALAFAHLAGPIGAGVVVGALGRAERVGLQRASSLRDRGVVALLCGAGACVGCGAVVLQVGFTRAVMSRASLEAGYRAVDGLVVALAGADLVLAGLIAALLAIVTFVRLCHASLRAQLASASCLTPLLVAGPVLLLTPLAAVGAASAAIFAVCALVVVLRGLDALEPDRPAPSALPVGAGRRVLLTVAVALLGVASLHGGLTLFAARRRASALDALANRGLPTRLQDARPPDDEDAFVLYRRAAEHPMAETALALLREGAGRPRCWMRGEDAWRVRQTVGEMLTSQFKERMNQDDVAGAVAIVRLRRDLFARAESLSTWRELAMGFDAADSWLAELLARRELSADACHALNGALESPIGDAFARASVTQWRIDFVEEHAVPQPWEPLGARLPWVRDLALVEALAHADLVEATLEEGGVSALRTLDPELARWWPSLGAEGRDVRYMTEEVVTATDAYETRRRLYVVALSLRLHRLATGSYPATLNALVPEPFAVVPSDVTGVPFVYTPAGTGFTLTPAGATRPVVRVYF